MIFMGKWNRRAEVMTIAEWMEFRFGKKPAGRGRADSGCRFAQLIFAIWAISYFIQGAGIFLRSAAGHLPGCGRHPDDYPVCLLCRTERALYGVVYTEVFQGALIMVVIVYVVYTVMATITLPENLRGFGAHGRWYFPADYAPVVRDWASFCTEMGDEYARRVQPVQPHWYGYHVLPA